MLKNFSLMKRKEGMSLDEFRKWALEEHVELGKNIPGMLTLSDERRAGREPRDPGRHLRDVV